MVDVIGAVDFIQEHIGGLLFAVFFFSLIVWMIRMNVANGPYKNFQLAHLVMRHDGTLDRKAFRETILFLVSVYGFVHVVQHKPEILVEYFWAMTSTWLGAHLLSDKFPSKAAPGDARGAVDEHPRPEHTP